MTREVDLIVLGSGPGGYVAALRAAELGLQTVVVEKDPHFGGTCLHRGCIPTKAMLHTAALMDQIRNAAAFGVSVEEPSLDLERAHSYKNRVIRRNARGIEHLFRRAGVETLQGSGTLLSAHRVAVEEDGDTTELSARFIVLATGSTAQSLPIAPVDGERIVDSTCLLEQKTVPASLAVLGAGAVGVEFASIFASFGSEVSLVEVLPHILPQEDHDISKELEAALRKRGIRVLTDTTATYVELRDAGLLVGLDQQGTQAELEVERLLVAVGRRPCTEELGLENLGISVNEGGFIEVGAAMQTSCPHVYAIGDLLATPQLAHLASAEGRVAVEHLAGLEPRPINYDAVPSCTYCDPEVASVGLTEAAARLRYEEVSVARASFAASGKAAILGRREGFVKVVRETADDRLLGMHILGAQATELIGEACLALGLESTTEEIFRTVHAHPTLSESIMDAARALDRGKPQ